MPIPRAKTLEELQREMWGGMPLFGAQTPLGGPLLPGPEDEQKRRKFRLIPLTEDEEQAVFRSVLQNERVRKLQRSFLANAGANPDQIARLLQLSEDSGYPVWMLDHEGDAKKQAEQISLLRRSFIRDWSAFLEDNPATAEFLGEPTVMAIAHDDIPNLVKQESIWRRIGHLFRAIPEGLRIGGLQVEYAELGERLKASRRYGVQKADEREYQRRVSQFLAGRVRAERDWERAAAYMRRGEDPRRYEAIGPYVRWHLEYPGLSDAEIIERMRYSEIWTPGDQARLEQIEAFFAEEAAKPQETGLAYAVKEAAKFWPQMFEGIKAAAMSGGTGAGAGIGAAAAGIKTARAAGAIGRAGAFAARTGLKAIESLPIFETARGAEAGAAYLDLMKMLEENGVTGPEAEQAAARASEIVGVINGALEVVEFDAFAGLLGGLGRQAGKQAAERLLKNLLLRPTVRRAILKTAVGIARNVGTEAMTEVLQELTNIAAEEIVNQAADVGAKPPTKREIAIRLFETFKAVTAGSGVYAAIGLPANLGRSVRIVRAARQQTMLVQELNNTAKDSKTRQRMPLAMRKFVEIATKNGPVEAAYIDAAQLGQVLQQQGIEPGPLLEEIGVSQEDYQQALAEGPGGKIAVSIGTYQSQIAGTNLGLALVQDTTFDPEVPTARETAAHEAQIKKEQESIIEKAREIVAQDTTIAAEHAWIRESLRAQHIAAGRPIREATYAAEIGAAFFTTIGRAAGQSPRALYESLNLRIEGEKGGKSAPAIIKKKTKTAPVAPIAVAMADRRWDTVGDRTIPSYQSQHPELAPHIQAEARLILAELGMGVKGEKGHYEIEGAVRGEEIVHWGAKRTVSSSVERILDQTGATYAEVQQALEDIIKGRGAENYALAKRIELIIDENLEKGIAGDPFRQELTGQETQEPNAEYIALRDKLDAQTKSQTLEQQAAYHGTVADIERFSTAQIGTGLGGRHYGWGLYFTGRREMAEHWRDLLAEREGKAGRLYQVDIPEDSDLLDWDAPLSRQPVRVKRWLEEVRKVVPESIFAGDPTGEAFYNALAEHLGSDREASILLRNSGIPGLRRHTRLMGGATNYTIFDETTIRITQRYYQPGISPLGFYSAVERTITGMDFKSIPAGDLLARIRKTPGIKAEELDWLGLPEWLEAAAQDGRKVTKEEVLQFIQAGGVQVEEVVHGQPFTAAEVEKAARQAFDRDWEAEWGEEGTPEDKEAAWLRSRDDYISRFEAYAVEYEVETQTKFGQYTLPGGENYREVLLTLPKRGFVAIAPNNINRQWFETQEEADRFAASNEGWRVFEASEVENKPASGQYISPHWPGITNPLAHFRLTDRTDAQGRRVMFIEEIQSDWHQTGREKGYQGPPLTPEESRRHDELLDKARGGQDMSKLTEEEQAEYSELHRRVQRKGVPNAPFKATESWAMLCFKRILRMAAEQGYDAVAWTPGEVHFKQWGSQEIAWVREGDVWRVSGQSQVSGYAAGIDLEAEARARGLLRETEGEIVATKDDLRRIIDRIMGDEPEITRAKTADRIWERMQTEEAGTSLPRKEGLEGFYDKILPSAVGKYVQKLNPAAKVETTQIVTRPDTAGITLEGAFEARFEPENYQTLEVWSIAMTPTLREAVLGGQPYFQPDAGQPAAPRGELTVDPSGMRIAFGPRADASTVVHEGAHTWLLLLQRLGEQEGATEEIRDLWQQTKAWTHGQEAFSIAWDQGGLSQAIKDRLLATYGARERVFAAFSGSVQDPDLQRIAHEAFAKAFELYLERGEAPTPTLRKAFEQFRQWLIAIYRRLAGQEVEISDEVKDLFDRMLAGDRALADTRARQEVDAMTERLIAEDPEQSMEASRLLEEVQREAEAKLLPKIAGEFLGRAAEARRQAEIEMAPEVEQELRRLPAYRLMADIAAGEAGRISTEALRAYTEDLDNVPPILHAEDGTADPEDLAEAYGFTSADEMIQTLIDTPPLDEAVQTEVRRRLDAEAAGIDIEAEAMDALHNERLLDLLAMEEQILAGRAEAAERRAAAQARTVAMRTWAKKTMAGKRWLDARRIQDYVAAEHRAAREAVAALTRGDREAAATAKYNQLLQAALTREAFRLDREFREIEKRFARITGRRAKNMLGLQAEDLLQLDALLARFGWGRGVPAGVAKKSLAKYLEEKADEGYTVSFSEAMANEGFTKSQHQLTAAEVLDLNDAVMNIMRIGRMQKRLLTQREQVEIEAAAAELSAAARTNLKVKPKEYQAWRSLGEKVKSGILSFHYAHMKIEHLCRLLDGGRNFGPWQRYIYQIMADANGVESTLRARAREDLAAIIRRYYGKDEIGNWARHPKDVPELGKGRRMTKENLICLALNWGNEGNRDRVIYGQGWTEEQVMAALDRLEKRDWDFVQAIWDYLDQTYWPLCQQVVERTGGIIREKVQPASVHTRFGTYRGGYYPIKADTLWSEMANRNAEAESAELFLRQQHLNMQTPQGHLKERAAHLEGRPVKLTLDVLTTHLNNVIHDAAFRPAIRDALKLIRSKTVETAIKDTLGLEAYREFEPWLSNIASEYREPFDVVSKVLSRARRNSSIVNMGWKATVALSQIAGVFPMAQRIGLGRVVSGLIRFYVNPFGIKAKIDFVTERSAMMADRARNMDRDVRDAIKNLIDRNAWTAAQETMFNFIALMDQAVTIPGWIAAYELEMERSGGNEERAIQYADSVIRQTQGTGYMSDLAGVQRGSEYKRLFTQFYSYFNTVYNMMAESIQMTRRIQDIPQLAATVLYVWLLPAVVSELLAGRGPGEEPKDKKKWWLWTVLGYPFSAVVGLRDIARGLMYREYQMSPTADAGQAVVNFVRRVGAAAAEPDTERIRKAAESTIEMLGYALGLPSRQIIITAGALIDWLTGEGETYIRDLLFAKPRERRD